MPLTDPELEALCAERQGNVDMREVAQNEIDRLGKEIGNELGLRQVDRVELKSFIPTVIVMDRKTVDKQKLVEAGVPIETIEACTVVTVVQQLRVTKRTGKS